MLATAILWIMLEKVCFPALLTFFDINRGRFKRATIVLTLYPLLLPAIKQIHMNRRNLVISILLYMLLFVSCGAGDKRPAITTGAERTEAYLPLIRDQRVGLVVNHTSLVQDTHLVDTLLASGVQVVRVFAPEHGFRGDADAGEQVADGRDGATGLPVVSLYGRTKKPTADMLADLDVLVFDIQDVGTRFYTYISTMHYVMEACAEHDKLFVVLDRPNPNGYYVDGPVREHGFESFVGMHPIPVVHGLTVGELALMINGERWLPGGAQCMLEVVPVAGYNHAMRYALPVKPSPNLPNDRSVNLYPSLCLFEGTMMSVGRGTYFPFQVVGYPDPKYGDFTFTPRSIEGMAKNPKHEGEQCYGVDLQEGKEMGHFSVALVMEMYRLSGRSEDFFTQYFNTLAGTDAVRTMIENGKTEAEIRQSWQPALERYRAVRKKYLLYPDF
jgi:uncharacterized protein YbbC (DUF1343 family)